MDEHIASPGNFYGVYILVNANPVFKGRIYIGFTTNPVRRVRQHNREIKGGAWKTGGGKGPWDMVMIVHGFPSSLAALQFEWAWQQPKLSKRLKRITCRTKRKNESQFEFRFRIVCEMLAVGPWNRLPLVIRWLKQEYMLNFPLHKQPPLHMAVAHGPILTVKKHDKKKTASAPEKCGTHQSNDDNESSSICSQGSEAAINWEDVCCNLCGEKDVENSHNQILCCVISSCSMKAHMFCLADNFLAQQNEQRQFLLPISGVCPGCGTDILWRDLIKQEKHNRQVNESDDSQLSHSVSDNDEDDDDDVSEQSTSSSLDDQAPC